MDIATATTPTDLIALVRETCAAVRVEETRLVVLATAWADSHPDPEAEADRVAARRPDVTDIDQDLDPDEPDPRVPASAWDAGASFAAAMGVSTSAGEAMIRDALVLRHRLPQVWERVLAHEVPVWRARRIAQAVLGKPDDVAGHLDEAVGPVAEKVGPVTLERLIDEAMMRLYPEERELAQLEALDARHATLHEESLVPAPPPAQDQVGVAISNGRDRRLAVVRSTRQRFLRDGRGTTDVTPLRHLRDGPGRETGCRRDPP